MLKTRGRVIAGVIGSIAAITIIVQFGLNIDKAALRGLPYWQVPLDLYGYFTIWSNTLVALVGGSVALDRKGFLTRPATLAATAVYILVVGAIYNFLLIGLNPVAGLAWVTDRFLHMVIPAAYVLWWLGWVPRGQLAWNALLPTLVFPTAYSLVAMTKGGVTGKYAYFFLDIGKLGLPAVVLNIAGLVLFFAGLMAVVIAWDRWAARTGASGSPA